MSVAGVTIDGTDLGDFGVVLSREASGWHDIPNRQFQTSPIPERSGSILLTKEPAVHPLQIRLRGWQTASTQSQLRDREDDLKALLMSGRLEVIFDSRPDRLFKAWLNGRMRVEAIGPRFATTKQRIEADLIAPDPLMYSTQQYQLGLSQVAVPQGNGPVAPTVEITGAVTDPTITYRDGDGSVVQEFGLSASIPAGETWTIDMEAHSIVDGSGSGRIDAFASGDWIVMHGRDVTPAGDPTIEVAPDPGGGGQVIYRKSFFP